MWPWQKQSNVWANCNHLRGAAVALMWSFFLRQQIRKGSWKRRIPRGSIISCLYQGSTPAGISHYLLCVLHVGSTTEVQKERPGKPGRRKHIVCLLLFFFIQCSTSLQDNYSTHRRDGTGIWALASIHVSAPPQAPRVVLGKLFRARSEIIRCDHTKQRNNVRETVRWVMTSPQRVQSRIETRLRTGQRQSSCRLLKAACFSLTWQKYGCFHIRLHCKAEEIAVR